jgi:hypothetical protein
MLWIFRGPLYGGGFEPLYDCLTLICGSNSLKI